MFNKKLLAASLAVAFSSSTFAVDLTDADTAITFAEELITTADVNADGRVAVSNDGATVLDATFPAGFSVGAGTSKYVLVTLNNAVLGTAPGVTLTSGSLSKGGAAGDTYALFEVTPVADIAQDDILTFHADAFEIDRNADVTVTAAMYETAAQAIAVADGTSPAATGRLSNTDGAFASIASVNTGEFVVANDVTATVSSDPAFTEFSAGQLTATTAQLGHFDISMLLAGDAYDTGVVGAAPADAAAAITAADLLSATTQDVTIEGNFTYGTWTLEDEADCTDIGGAASVDVNAALDADKLVATLSGLDVSTNYYLCVNTGGAVIPKSTYTATLVADELTDEFGVIKYDTTAIEVPYLTTFSGYNQRLYMVNYGSSDVAYSISFNSEDGTTAEAGSAATGTIPAGEMLMVKATDVVTLTGRSRTSAVIEVEAVDADIAATTQTVNLSDGSTDTVVLN